MLLPPTKKKPQKFTQDLSGQGGCLSYNAALACFNESDVSQIHTISSSQKLTELENIYYCCRLAVTLKSYFYGNLIKYQAQVSKSPKWERRKISTQGLQQRTRGCDAGLQTSPWPHRPKEPQRGAARQKPGPSTP